MLVEQRDLGDNVATVDAELVDNEGAGAALAQMRSHRQLDLVRGHVLDRRRRTPRAPKPLRANTAPAISFAAAQGACARPHSPEGVCCPCCGRAPAGRLSGL